MSEKIYTATVEKYREHLAKIATVDDEIKELRLSKKEIILNAEKEGCSPKILRQMAKLAKMNQDEQQALQDALDMA